VADNTPPEGQDPVPPAGGAREPLKFDPATLDRSLVSLELMDAIRKASDSDPLDVIIDLNLSYPKGRDAAEHWVVRWLNKRLKSDPRRARGETPPAAGDKGRREALNRTKSRYSQQYVFAALTRQSLRALVVDLKAETQPAKPAAAASPADKKVEPKASPVYKIWLDHDLKPFANVSIVTVKADAARAAFSADGEGIVWAVADSGVDAGHPHFELHENLVNLPAPLQHRDFTGDGGKSVAASEIAACQDQFGHGTHVAGIIAGEIRAVDKAPAAGERAKKIAARDDELKDYPALAFRRERDDEDNVSTQVLPLKKISGMAPCCKLLSLKVLDADGVGKASSLIAAIEYIQHLNGNGRLIRVHGVNISVGYSYRPEWFACGQSPLCVEIDRLVRSGVCVVVAAGNDGYGFVNSLNADSAAAGLDVTIADPGNSDMAITVGSTHREMPHTYGVSYFSSKGPTGDGRLKPDILAPGEKILSCMSAQMTDEARRKAKLSKQTIDETVAKARDKAALYREDSGTSMAAPHVSGVIAAFLSNRREFIGRPQTVKEVFLSTATDLKRSTYFQGKGLVDLMRAIQSI
jgi:subtilisin family serine protease